MDTASRTVLVTGATSGIGRATALAFASSGATVVVVGRRSELLDETARLVDRAGGTPDAVVADLTHTDQVDALVDGVLARHGRLDAAVNNAGTLGSFAPMLEQTEADLDGVLSLNLKAVWWGVRAQARAMISTGRPGAIVNVSSWLSTGALPGSAAYSASKAGVDGLMRAAAVELAPHGIRINNVNPGGIDTEMTRLAFGDDAEVLGRFGRQHPVGRLGSSEEVAAAITFLCSDAASFIHGQAVPVDGGYTIPGQR